MGASVLVIEDNHANLELLMFLLRAFGHTPLPATEGREALEMARRNPPDLILCDLQLPVMDGYELARRLRAEPTLREVPVVAVTAFAMPGDREKAIAAGCDGYIPKPINPESFISLLDPFLRPEIRSRRAGTEEESPRDAATLDRAGQHLDGSNRIAPRGGNLSNLKVNGHANDPHC